MPAKFAGPRDWLLKSVREAAEKDSDLLKPPGG